MDTKIIKNGSEVTIKLQNPTGKDVKKGMKLLFASQKAETENEQVEKFEEFFDFVDDISAKYTNMTIDELDDLENNEKTKIISFYLDEINKRFDFLKSSLMRGN